MSTGTYVFIKYFIFQIAPAAKKLWGIESKDASSKLALNHLNHEGVWRDPTWAAPGE